MSIDTEYSQANTEVPWQSPSPQADRALFIYHNQLVAMQDDKAGVVMTFVGECAAGMAAPTGAGIVIEMVLDMVFEAQPTLDGEAGHWWGGCGKMPYGQQHEAEE